jgi:protein O-GlcNAc transferase
MNDSQSIEKAKSFFLSGLEKLNKNNFIGAEIDFESSLSLAPNRLSTLINLSIVLIKLNKFENAEKLINKGLLHHPKNEELLLGLVDIYKKLIIHQPDYAEAHVNLGNSYKELKMYDEALSAYNTAIILNPNLAEVFSNRGNVMLDLKKYQEALSDYEKAIAFKSDLASAYSNRGIALRGLKRLDDALTSFGQAIKFQPDYAEAYYNQGITQSELNYFDEALASYDKAIEINPDYIQAYSNRGSVLQDLNRLHEALASNERAIEIYPNYAEAYLNRGNIFKKLLRLDEALISFDRTIEIKPDYAQAYYNRGNTLSELKRLDEAIASYDKAIEIKPDYAQAYYNRGNTLSKLKRLDEAIASYDKAIEINPNYAEAYCNRGNALKAVKLLDEALVNYNKASELKPDFEYLLGYILHIKMHVCDWHDFRTNIEKLLLLIGEGKKSSLSFPVLALSDSLSIHRKASETWINDKHPFNTSLGIFSKTYQKEKIKIGYYSADFHNHATSYLMAELFEKHDKSKFEIIAFSFGPDLIDDMRHRIKHAFDQFVDVRFKSDSSVAALSRQMGINIAVDLKGYTEGERMGIFSYRAAPIQINYIGFPGTLAAQYFDYIVADKTLIPKQYQQYYTEKVVYLPNSYQVNDSKRQISNKVFTKEESGLPNEGFVFCCFNHNYKITPYTFDGWVRILKGVEGSVLWLLVDNPTAKLNLRNEAEARGLNPNRLIFANSLKLPEHLARHKVADLFIDTLPYNAHTTASDALWAGLPVLTCMGESFASRVAASLLNAIELPELITTSQAEYEAKAIELANNPAKLKAIKDKLERNRLTTALFDTPRYTKHIEAAYMKMYERYQADLLPDHIYIDAQ